MKARIEEFCALAGHEHIHKGMTSRDLTENVEQLQVRRSLEIVRDRLVALLARFSSLAERHAGEVMVARTHNVAAQATTLGKRFADVAEETMIGFERVEFSYGDEPVLHAIDLTIHRGETVALVGASGSGKSTLANLLPRFYDVRSSGISARP